jgi:hypothetical protein
MPTLNLLLAESDFLRSPAWFPLRIEDGGAMTVVKLDEAAYVTASFLDERILVLEYPQTTCALTTIYAAAATLAPRAHYVFHTGHVGSTLISRLIGEHEGFFSLREPALLRAFAGEPTLQHGAVTPDAAASLAPVLALLARTWRTSQRAVIKPTSFVSELAEVILAGDDRPSAIFMFTTPLNYIRGILAGPNSRVEAKSLAPARRHRLVRRLGGVEWRSNPHSEGEQVAMSWLCEMTALHQAALRFESQVLWVNFDAFLSEPLSGLQSIFRTLGAAPSCGELEALVTGPLMRQYSKAPQHAYDAALRREVLQSADWQHGVEIKRGMDWLSTVAKNHSLATAALESAARVRSTE